MQKTKEEEKRGKKNKEYLVVLQIFNLILATIAFSVILSESVIAPLLPGENPAVVYGTPKKPEPQKGLVSEVGSGAVAGTEIGTPFTPIAVPLDKSYPVTLPDKTTAIATNLKSVGSDKWQLLDANGKAIGEPMDTAAIKNTNIGDPNLFKSVDGKIVNFNPGKPGSIFTNGKNIDGTLSADGNALLGGDGKIYQKGAGDKWTQTGASTSTGPKQTTLSNLFGVTQGGFMDAALSGVQYAAIWYGIGQLVGSIAGMEKKETEALSTALAAGAFTYEMLYRYNDIGLTKDFWAGPGEKGLFGMGSGPGALGTGIIVAVIVFIVMYEKESKEIVTFSCKPWQAPVGRIAGNDCEKCNLEEGCSEYRCKSLGQACQLLNAGTTDEKCAWVNPKDTTSPQISMWEDVLTKGYKYEPDTAIRPPARGVKILKATGDKCVKAFTPLEFGILTDEPSQCKIDYNHTLKFSDMAFYFGESNLFAYNHSQKMSLPSPSSIQAAAPELGHNGTYTLYARCQDANGNANVDEFAVRFCVEAGPDTTPPEIMGTSIANNMPVKYNQSNVELEVYVNEPSECKWSREDRGYEELENSMVCNKNVWEMNNNNVYTCKTTLTGVKDRQENVFWVRCKDQPWANESERNKNQQGYKFTLAGTEPLNIIDIKPNGTLYGSTDVVSIWLEVETANGYRNGNAVCYFSDTKSEADYIEFADTGSSMHKQRLDLIEGGYKYYVKCLDLGGNRDDNETEFRVEVDREAPVIARVYREDEVLKVITIEDSECRYSIQSCNFKFEDGIDMPYANQTTHAAEWKTENTYYIRCSDRYNNQPLPNSCSMIVRPYDVVRQIVEE